MLIETYDLTKKYGKKLALNAVNLKIDKGQLVAYLGTNGAGKTTTINLLTGLLKPTSGAITYADSLRMGIVFQNSVLDNSLTVKDNLHLRARMYKDYSNEWLHQLIARALINKPNLLFLDEPTTGLDLQTRLVLWHLLQKLQQEQGLTIFLTTHYLEEAENADQMYILENGNILASGPAAEIEQKYAPTKLLVNVRDIKSLKISQKYQVINPKLIEIMSLTASETIDFLSLNQNVITNFEYYQGSINDAFIKITGKELQ